MKKIAMLILSAIFVYSCTIAEISEPQSDSAASPIKSDMEIIYSWGYDTTSVQSFDDYYLIDGELVFFKDAINKARTAPGTRLNAYEERIPKDFQRIYFNVYVDPIDPNYKQEYVMQAVEAWNDLEDCNIMFMTDIEGAKEPGWFGPLVLELRQEPWYLDGSGMITVAPLVDYAGTISIKTSDECWQKLSDEQRKYAVMHALGHLIGLKDNDEAPWVPGTNSSDYDSIMKPSDAITDLNKDYYWSGFSFYDKKDIPYMYPLYPESMFVSVSPELENDVLETDREYTFSVSYESLKPMTGISYKMTVDYTESSLDDVIVVSDDDEFDIKLTEPGVCTISLEMIGKDGKTRIIEEVGTTYTVASIVDEFEYPSFSQIELDKTFRIKWKYENSMYPDAYVEFTAGEEYFDNGTNKNVTVSVLSDYEADVTIHDYGKYRIKLNLKNGPSEVLDKVLILTKLYRPDIAIEPDYVVWDCPQSVYYGDQRPIPSDCWIIEDEDDGYHIMTLGDSPQLQERVYMDYALKYYINRGVLNDIPYPEHYLMIDHIGTLTFQKGSSNVYSFPRVRECHLTYVNEHGISLSDSYIPFYMAEYPKDGLSVIGK